MDQRIDNLLSHWGPALLICLTVVVGLFYQNSRFSDLKDATNKRFEDLNRRFEDLNKRIDDLKDYIRSEFKRVEERIDRLESPISRR